MTDSNFANLQGMEPQAAQDRDTLAGALGGEAPYVPGGSSDNSGGTGIGGATDNTRTEQAGESPPSAVEGTAGIEGSAGPSDTAAGAGPSDTGGGGGGAVVSGQPAAALSNEPTTPQTSVLTNTITTGDLPAIPAAVLEQPPTAEPTAINIPPLDLDETQTIDEDGVATGNVLLNVEDPDGGPAVVTQFTIPGDPTVYQPGQTATIEGIGTITIGSDGAYLFTPEANYNGSVPPINYTVSDGAGGTDSSTLSITVTPVNDPPVDGDESQTINEDNPATGNVLLNVVDPDGGTPVVTQFSVPGDPKVYLPGETATIAGVGTITIGSDGAYLFTPEANYNGSVPPINYTVSDGAGGTDSSTLSITVTPVNDLLLAVADTNTIAEDAVSVSGTVITNDTLGDGTAAENVVSLNGNATGTYGSIVLNADGSYVYTLDNTDPLVQQLAPGETLEETYSYTLTDKDGDTSTTTLKITITGTDDVVTITNLTPPAQGGDVSVNEDDLLASRGSGDSAGSDASKESTTQGGTFTISAPDGVQTLIIGGLSAITNGVFVSVSGATPLGNSLAITAYDAVTGTVSYTYTLNDNEAHAAGSGTNSLFEDLAVSLTDRDGDNSTSTLSVNIIDDVPTAVVDTDSVTEDGLTVATGNVITGTDVNVSPDSNATDGVADTRGADEASISGASSSNVPANSDNTADGSNNFQVVGQYGSLVLNTNGSYSYTLNNSLDAVQTLNTGQTLTDTFSYTLNDGDGDTSTTTLTITINGVTDDKGIVVGQNISDTFSTQGTVATTDDHVVDNTPGKPDGPIDGTSSNDVLIGDIGGATTAVVPGAKYNIVIIADTSGSMAWDAATGNQAITTVSRINLLKSSLTNLVNQLDDHSSTGGKVNISLVNFASDVKPVDLNGSAAGAPSSVIDLTTQNSAGVISAVDSLSATGGTNYDAAFAKAASEVDALQAYYSSAQGYQTITYFLTDGDPTYYINNRTGALGGNGISTTARELNEAIEAFASLSSKSAVYAIGIGTSTNASYLQFFDNTSNPVTKTITVGGVSVTGPAGTPDVVTNGDQLDSALQGGSSTPTIGPVGNDVINGGSGVDAILGDSIFSTSIDKGWAGYVAANPSLMSDKAKADDIYANLTSSNPSYATEGTVGGNDTIDAGAGNDIVFGQGGNDVISGGAGDDRIVGGTGADTLTGGDGADQFVFLKGQGSTTQIDTITDFAKGIDTIVVSGSAITGVSVSAASTSGSTSSYAITVTYSDATPTDTFKLALTNGGTLNDAGKNQTNGVILVGGATATIDGTIVGATVYLDVNHDGIADAGEIVGVSDQLGHIEYVVDLATLDVNRDGEFTIGEARAVLNGGTDIDTNLSYEINLFGPAGSVVITPFTSLLQPLVEGGQDLDSASQLLADRLGLRGVSDLLSLNPIKASAEILGQNAAVMTAAVQFSELAARQLGTDEAHASWTVFSSISHVLASLPDGEVADFSSTSLLSAIADQLQLHHLVSNDVMEFMAASQLSLQHSLTDLPADVDALAAVSAVQHLVQGSYAQVLGSAAEGDLAVHTLDDLTQSLTAYRHGDLSLDQLQGFDQQLNLAGTHGQITDSEVTQALSCLPDQADIPTLISSYLDTIAKQADSNGDGVADQSPGSAELAYHLDSMITDFIDQHSLSDGAYASIHQDLMDHLAHGINEVIPGQDQDLAFNDQGHVTDDAAVLAALDQHFQDLVDHHSSVDSVAYGDQPGSDHPGF